MMKKNIQQKGILDVSGLDSGIFIINIKTNKEIFTAKILKKTD